MKHHLLTLFLAFAACLSAAAQDNTAYFFGIRYQILDDEARTCKVIYAASYETFATTKPQISVASSVDINGKTYTVTTIDDGAFLETAFTSISLPEGITTIGHYAFEGCTNLTYLNIPSTVTTIGEEAFGGAPCFGSKVQISVNLREIGFAAFSCPGLTEYSVAVGNPNFCSIDGVLFSKDRKTLIDYPWGRPAAPYTVPAGTTTIAQDAFSGRHLTSLTLPEGLTTIIEYAFWDSTIDGPLTLPASLTDIDEDAFCECHGVTAFNIAPASTTFASRDGVLFSKDMTTLRLYPIGRPADAYIVPDGVTTIGANAFRAAQNLKHLYLPEGLTTISPVAVYGCHNLADIIIPVSVTSIGGYAFADCRHLANIYCLNTASVTGCSHCSYILGNARNGNVVLTDCYWNADATLTRSQNNNLYDYCGNVEGNLSASNYQGLTAEQIAAGAAAFLLQDGRPETAWGQNLAASEAYPTPSASARVYLSEGAIDCLGHVQGGGSYTNTAGSGTILGHTWQNGYCTTCHAIESAPALVGGSYEIGNAGQLLWFARQSRVNGAINAKLTADIDLSVITHPADAEHGIEAAEWEMIGYDSDAGYTGIFDGQGHTVSNYYICNKGNVGFFRTLAGTVRNLKLAGGLIEAPTTRFKLGLLAGSIIYGTVSNVEVLSGTINVDTGCQYIGGIAGETKQTSRIEDCIIRSAVTIKGGTFVGGIAGNPGSAARIERCSNYATIQGQDAVGGIAGNAPNVVFTDCLNAGPVISNYSYNKGVAGIVADGNVSTRIINCLNVGNITASRDRQASLISNIGYAVAITNCYASADAVVTEDGSPVAEPRLYQLTSGNPEFGTVVADRLTAEQLSNGYAAFALQAQRNDRDYWGQELTADALPVIGSSHRVFLNGHLSCAGNVIDGTYSNSPSHAGIDAHTWTADRICSACGAAEEPVCSADVYQIANAGNLLWFQREVTLKANNSINAALTADIDLSGITDAEHPWAPIGSESNEFRGSFDGQGHSITGLTINDTKLNRAALFGYTRQATIQNLKVEANVTAKNYSAILAGNCTDSKVTNCTTRGTVSGYQYVGGLVGQNSSSQYTDCTNYATVASSYNNVGGLIGYAQYGKMDHCFNHGAVTCTETSNENHAGGLVGRIYDGMKIDHCANYGNVTGAGTSVGGLIGYNSGSSSNNHVYYCANHGNVSGKYAVGGLCGWMQGQDWNHCFNAGDVVAKEEGNNGRTFGYYVTVDNFDNIYYDATRTYTEVRVEEGTKRVAFTREQLESGEAAYTLGAPFGQRLGTDLVPRLDAPQVYYGRYQHAVAEPIFAEAQYSNLIVGDATTDHHYDDGVCTICGKHDAYIWELAPTGTYADWTSNNHGQNNSTSQHVYTFTGVKVGNHISFDWSVSSEDNCDWFYATLTLPDGTTKELVRRSGRVNDTTPYSGSIDHEANAAGTYLLTVKYVKDGSVDRGADQATVTNVHGPKLAATDKAWGDVNTDGTFDLDDVTAIRGMLLNPTTATLKADFNADGTITIADVVEAIRQLIMP